METDAKPPEFRPLDGSGVLSWVHFGDLHVTGEGEENLRDFRALVARANEHLTGGGHEGGEGKHAGGAVSFAVLPGDNADDGTAEQFRLVRRALDDLRLPVLVLPGDHDLKAGSLDDFFALLRPAPLPCAFAVGDQYRCLFVNSVDVEGTEGFGHGRAQLDWLARELTETARAGQRPVVFMHTYPAELGDEATDVLRLFRRFPPLVVDMGHTHYNEVANDGRTLYFATRSTGQTEEGPAGFSVANLDAGVVSWKFKTLATPWPFVMITSPADRAFLRDDAWTEQVVRGVVEVRAKVWDGRGVQAADCRAGDGNFQRMTPLGDTGVWRCAWDSTRVPDGPCPLTVRVENTAKESAPDTVTILVAQTGAYAAPRRHWPGDDANALGAYPEKGLLGTQLGPNKNGRKW